MDKAYLVVSPMGLNFLQYRGKRIGIVQKRGSRWYVMRAVNGQAMPHGRGFTSRLKALRQVVEAAGMPWLAVPGEEDTEGLDSSKASD